MGSAWAFTLALAVVLVWAMTGPIFRYSEAWQLVINTGTTIVTFLMVFLIQNTQNREVATLQLKLDELIFATKRARNDLMNLEELSDEELTALKHEFEALGAHAGHLGKAHLGKAHERVSGELHDRNARRASSRPPAPRRGV